MRSIHAALYRQGLARSTSTRIIGGVCGGLAAKFGVDAWAVRLILILSMMLLPGSQLILYPIAWILMPDDRFALEAGSGPQSRPEPMVTLDEGYRYDRTR